MITGSPCNGIPVFSDSDFCPEYTVRFEMERLETDSIFMYPLSIDVENVWHIRSFLLGLFSTMVVLVSEKSLDSPIVIVMPS